MGASGGMFHSDVVSERNGGYMITWLENLYSGIVGRFLRASLSTAVGVLAAHYAANEWYIAAGPLLQLVGKTLRDKNPGSWLWLPF